MRKWNFVALLMVMGIAFAPLANAQQNDGDLRKEINELKRNFESVLKRQAVMERENDELRSKLDNVDAIESNLEGMINSLSNTDFAAGTSVESGANPITIFGHFRTRSGYTFDRDFGRETTTFNEAQSTNGGIPTGSSTDDVDDDGTFVDARFLLGFDFNLDRDVHARLSVQANGLYGNGGTPGNLNFAEGSFFSDGESSGSFNGRGLDIIEVYEAWIQVNNIFGRSELSARSGRQEIVLGNEFQFGNNDFFSGETFDGTRWTWENDNFALHFIFAKLAVRNSFNSRNHPFATRDDGFDDDELYSLYFTLKTIEDHELDLYWIYFNGHNGGTVGSLGNSLGSYSFGDGIKDVGGRNFYYHTIGGRIGGELAVAAGLDWNVEVAYQFGSLSGTDTDVDGLAIEAEVGLTFDADYNFRVFIRFLWAQGADTDDDETGYIPLFTERHAQAGSGGTTDYRARYGILDIIPLDNVLTVQVGTTFDPAQDWTLGLTFLWAQHDEDVFVNGEEEDGIGFEIDVFAEYRYSSQTAFSAGLGVFFPEEGAPLKGFSSGPRFAGDDDDIAFLFYLQTVVNF